MESSYNHYYFPNSSHIYDLIPCNYIFHHKIKIVFNSFWKWKGWLLLNVLSIIANLWNPIIIVSKFQKLNYWITIFDTQNFFSSWILFIFRNICPYMSLLFLNYIIIFYNIISIFILMIKKLILLIKLLLSSKLYLIYITYCFLKISFFLF